MIFVGGVAVAAGQRVGPSSVGVEAMFPALLVPLPRTGRCRRCSRMKRARMPRRIGEPDYQVHRPSCLGDNVLAPIEHFIRRFSSLEILFGN